MSNLSINIPGGHFNRLPGAIPRASESGPENLHFYCGPRWCRCCFCGNHTLRPTALSKHNSSTRGSNFDIPNRAFYPLKITFCYCTINFKEGGTFFLLLKYSKALQLSPNLTYYVIVPNYFVSFLPNRPWKSRKRTHSPRWTTSFLLFHWIRSSETL